MYCFLFELFRQIILTYYLKHLQVDFVYRLSESYIKSDTKNGYKYLADSVIKIAVHKTYLSISFKKIATIIQLLSLLL